MCTDQAETVQRIILTSSRNLRTWTLLIAMLSGPETTKITVIGSSINILKTSVTKYRNRCISFVVRTHFQEGCSTSGKQYYNKACYISTDLIL
jgi:hypothetical protein